MCRYISYFNRATITKNFLIIPETPTSLRRRLDYRSDGLGHVLEGWIYHHGFLLRQVPTGGRNRHESIQQIFITIEHVRDKCRLETKCWEVFERRTQICTGRRSYLTLAKFLSHSKITVDAISVVAATLSAFYVLLKYLFRIFFIILKIIRFWIEYYFNNWNSTNSKDVTDTLTDIDGSTAFSRILQNILLKKTRYIIIHSIGAWGGQDSLK